MQKIPTVFKRNPDDLSTVLSEVNPTCQWVLDGEGITTRKFDGTCVMFDGSQWWARREVKPGKNRPDNFIEIEHDEVTGKTVGWEPIAQSPFIKAFTECMNSPLIDKDDLTPGTYELCGPKINNNPEGFQEHTLVPHGEWVLETPRDFNGLKQWLLSREYEGIVWHHPDGRMAKLKRKDFND